MTELFAALVRGLVHPVHLSAGRRTGGHPRGITGRVETDWRERSQRGPERRPITSVNTSIHRSLARIYGRPEPRSKPVSQVSQVLKRKDEPYERLKLDC